MKFVKSKKGYFYKIYKSGKYKRISELEFKKKTKKKQKGGLISTSTAITATVTAAGVTASAIAAYKLAKSLRKKKDNSRYDNIDDDNTDNYHEYKDAYDNKWKEKTEQLIRKNLLKNKKRKKINEDVIRLTSPGARKYAKSLARSKTKTKIPKRMRF